MSSERRRTMLDAEDERLVDEIARSLRPREMNGARARAFEMRLTKRLERGEGPSRAGAFAVAVAAAAAWILWFANPPATIPEPVTVAEERLPRMLAEGDAPPAPTLASTASDDDVDELDSPRVAAEDYLPDDYLMLAGMFGDADDSW